MSLAESLQISDAAIYTLMRLSQLESLNVTGCTYISDECGGALACMTTLTWLGLACTSCGVAAAQDLAALPRLRHVKLCPHWQLSGGRGKGGSEFKNSSCNTVQREDMILELVHCLRLWKVESSSCLLRKARSHLVYEGVPVPQWML